MDNSTDRCEAALQVIARWLGPQMTEDGSPTPTGAHAAMHALGPELVMDWQGTFTALGQVHSARADSCSGSITWGTTARPANPENGP